MPVKPKVAAATGIPPLKCRSQKDFGRLSTSSFIARKGERWEEIDSLECHHGTYCPYLNGEDVF
jgi:hypothetical protein